MHEAWALGWAVWNQNRFEFKFWWYIPYFPHTTKIRLHPLNFFLLDPDFATSTMGPILHLYYEESLVSSNLNSKLLKFHSVRPNEHVHNYVWFKYSCFSAALVKTRLKSPPIIVISLFFSFFRIMIYWIILQMKMQILLLIEDRKSSIKRWVNCVIRTSGWKWYQHLGHNCSAMVAF